MPCKFLYCTKHMEGPLDVWYDCSVCEQGSKDEALKHVRWLYKKQYKELLNSSHRRPSPLLQAECPSAGGTFWIGLAHAEK